MKVTNARKMYARYPKLFMAMFEHSFKENPEHPDDIGVIYSKIQANVANPGTYWMPDYMDLDPILEEFRKLREE